MSAQRGIAHLASLTWTQSAGPAMDKMRPPRDRDSGHLASPERMPPRHASATTTALPQSQKNGAARAACVKTPRFDEP